MKAGEKPNMRDLAFLFSILSLQFGEKCGKLLLDKSSEVTVKRSKTGRLRCVLLGNKPILYVNPSLGKVTLSEEGAKLLFPLVDKSRCRIFVRKELFVKHVTKSVLAPAVVGATDDVRAGDEVFIVSEDDELLAIGKALLSALEISNIRRGEVARVRRRIK